MFQTWKFLKQSEILLLADEEVDRYDKAYRRGLISDRERYEKVIDIWNKTTDDVSEALMDSLGSLNNLIYHGTLGSERFQEPDQTDRRHAWSYGECCREDNRDSYQGELP